MEDKTTNYNFNKPNPITNPNDPFDLKKFICDNLDLIDELFRKKADLIGGKLPASQLTIDDTPTEGSNNPISSRGAKAALDKKQNTEDAFSGDFNDLDNKPLSYPPCTHTYSFNSIENRPESYPPSAHTHPYIPISEKNKPNGVAGLNKDGKVSEEQLPEMNFYPKEQILTNALCTAFGLPQGSLPKDVFSKLASFRNNVVSEHVWSKNTVSYTYKTTTYSSLSINTMLFNNTGATIFRVSDTLEDALNGKYKEVTLLGDANTALQLNGKHIRSSYKGYSYIYEIPNKAQWSMWSSLYGYAVSCTTKYYDITPVYTPVGYVNSESKSAYPPAVPDEYTYIYKGQLGSGAVIDIVSYKGNKSYPRTIPLNFTPRAILLFNPEKVGEYGVWATGGNSRLYSAGNVSYKYDYDTGKIVKKGFEIINGNKGSSSSTANESYDRLNSTNSNISGSNHTYWLIAMG